jgi:pseudoazurin
VVLRRKHHKEDNLRTLALTVISFFFLSAAHAATHEIKMLNNGKEGIMVFEPSFLTAKKGDVVKFVPTDPAHDVASIVVPKGAKSWTGALGKAVTVTLTKEGLYFYECKSHVSMAMVGMIQVGKASNLAEVKKAVDELRPKIMMYKERLDQYLGKVQK